jgi:hypothetical protein
MAYIFRLALALLCVTLSYTAAASAVANAHCHDTAHAVARAVATTHVTVTPHAPANIEQSADVQMQHIGIVKNAEHHLNIEKIAFERHSDCNCAEHCGCPQHCVGSCAIMPSLVGALPHRLSIYVTAAYSTGIPDLRITPLYRPPIIALS